jgi:hypothetical protein
MNIQDKIQEIHHKYGVTEKANYEIQLFVEALLKEQKEQLILSGVGSSLPNRNTVISEIKNNLKEINEHKKVTNIDFDLGYSLGFFDGFDFNK